jgi:SAM-dependent methyltransferase
MMRNLKLLEVLREVAHQYPAGMAQGQVKDIPRISFNIGLVLEATKPRAHTDLEVCDLGGGLGLFSVGCAAYGMKRTVLVDDFGDPVNHQVGDSIFSLHNRLGVEVISSDVVKNGMRGVDGEFDAITTFDSMEHWHHSPKRLFHQVLEKLKVGGVFVLGVPNCVNMRKRITVPFGFGKWSRMQSWYEEEQFRAHVREPDVGDLMYIAQDMGLKEVRIIGRNWLGYNSGNQAVRFAAAVMDYPLRFKPSLCSDIQLVGRKG